MSRIPHNRTTRSSPSDAERAFDLVAPVFDATYENAITARLRERIRRIIQEHAPSGARILELNCGTGADALWFAERGYSVTATDGSAAMIREAQQKSLPRGRGRATFFRSSYDDLSAVPPALHDIVFSNFGGLNCTADLRAVAPAVAPRCAPGGLAILVVMPRFCLWEVVAGLVHLDWKFAFRRFARRPRASGFGEQGFDVTYHTVCELRRAFAPSFTLRGLVGLSVLSAPPHALNFHRSFPRLDRTLWKIDQWISRLPLFRASGDHYVAIFRRVHATEGG